MANYLYLKSISEEAQVDNTPMLLSSSLLLCLYNVKVITKMNKYSMIRFSFTLYLQTN